MTQQQQWIFLPDQQTLIRVESITALEKCGVEDLEAIRVYQGSGEVWFSAFRDSHPRDYAILDRFWKAQAPGIETRTPVETGKYRHWDVKRAPFAGRVLARSAQEAREYAARHLDCAPEELYATPASVEFQVMEQALLDGESYVIEIGTLSAGIRFQAGEGFTVLYDGGSFVQESGYLTLEGAAARLLDLLGWFEDERSPSERVESEEEDSNG